MSRKDERQVPSLAELAGALRTSPPARVDDEVLLRFCPRCGTKNIDVQSYGSPWTGQCKDCGASFSLMTVPVSSR